MPKNSLSFNVREAGYVEIWTSKERKLDPFTITVDVPSASANEALIIANSIIQQVMKTQHGAAVMNVQVPAEIYKKAWWVVLGCTQDTHPIEVKEKYLRLMQESADDLQTRVALTFAYDCSEATR